jgi:hypothetical protein
MMKNLAIILETLIKVLAGAYPLLTLITLAGNRAAKSMDRILQSYPIFFRIKLTANASQRLTAVWN